MTHTVESLMALARKFARHDMEPKYSESEAALQSALTEVLAELAEAKQLTKNTATTYDSMLVQCNTERLKWKEWTEKAEAEGFALQSKVESQAAEIERLQGSEMGLNKYLAKVQAERDTLQSKVAAMEKQEPVLSRRKTEPYGEYEYVEGKKDPMFWEHFYRAPGAAQKEPCIHKDVPSSCYRVRCQLGSKCIDDDMSFRAAPAAQPLTDDYLESLRDKEFRFSHGIGKEQKA